MICCNEKHVNYMREEGAGGGILPKCVFYIFEISKICNFPYTPECLK